MHHEILINASKEVVWDNIIDEESYGEWTAPFMPGSYFEGGWNKGDKIKFLAKNEKGEAEGMFSEIADSRPNEFLSIKHLGIIKDGKEDLESEEAKKWAPAHENYTLTEEKGKTKFSVDLDLDEKGEHWDMFNDIWPKALQKLKKLSESKQNM